ncbi:endonuclease V-domain-containing protein [Sporodiniella umbellata]|nr:endonuclease V-domain-containing protein [Sporodiniella umbellata]
MTDTDEFSIPYVEKPSEKLKRVWREQQLALVKKLQLDDFVSFRSNLQGLNYVGGVDLSFPLNDRENAVACLVVLTFPKLEVIYQEFLETKLHYPYIAGYLAFREVEPLMALLDNLRSTKPEIYPQVILVDGNGLLHPRQFGIASHLGVLSDTPTIGVAKNFLTIKGDLDDFKELKQRWEKTLCNKGDRFDLVGKSKTVYGTALRTSSKNPLFVSQGNQISLELAVKVVLATSPKYRIPEPIRMADLRSRAYIRTEPKKKNEQSKPILQQK